MVEEVNSFMAVTGMTERQIMSVIAGHIFGFWVLVWYALRLRKRLRCLGYCYIHISDWGIGRLNELKEMHIHNHSVDNTPFLLLDADRDWAACIEYHRGLFREVGLAPPGRRELNYIGETL